MQINHTVETPDGKVTFQGELSPEEVRVLIEFAINYFMAMGSKPFLDNEHTDLEKLN